MSKFLKMVITGAQGHFKCPNSSKIQQTFRIPPISTVVGIMKNIQGKDIDDFTFGYFIQYDAIERNIETIYKECNLTRYKNTDNARFTKDIQVIENLINPRLVIYSSLDKIEFNDVLVIGKANYLGTVEFSEVELSDKEGKGYNQFILGLDEGKGRIRRINTITSYNETKGFYEYKSILAKECSEFDYNKFYDSFEKQNIHMFKFSKGDVIVAN